jgi:UDP-2,4-diacetamido-2,4,6-trideoxy-beta-L-altropyranose hydrolase
MHSPIAFRVDGGPLIGTGHVMRCLTLADYWAEEGGTGIFLMAESTKALDERVASKGLIKIQLERSAGSRSEGVEAAERAVGFGAEWVAADGYRFGAEWQEAVVAAGLKLLLFDDFGHSNHYCADVVLNQNFQVEEQLYRNRTGRTKLLIGPRYALLGRQFLPWHTWQRIHSPIGKRVLVTFGGSDPLNITSFVIRAFESAQERDYELRIVIGGSNPRAFEIERAAQNCGQTCDVLRDVKDMAKHMAWADLAIMGGGTTCWEAAFMQLPAIAISCASHEDLLLDALSSHGVLQKLGKIEECIASDFVSALSNISRSKETRASMGARGRELIDGKGAFRVIDTLRGISQVVPE